MDEHERGAAVHDRRAGMSLLLALVSAVAWAVLVSRGRSLIWVAGAGEVAAVILGALSERSAKRQRRKASWFAVAGQVLGMAGVIGTVAVLLSHR